MNIMPGYFPLSNGFKQEFTVWLPSICNGESTVYDECSPPVPCCPMVLCQLLGIIIRICSKRFLPDKPLDGFYLPYLHSTVGCGFTGSPSLISQERESYVSGPIIRDLLRDIGTAIYFHNLKSYIYILYSCEKHFFG